MATGDVIGSILYSMPPVTSRANPGVRLGGATPGENVPILSFDDTTLQTWDFVCHMFGYDDASGINIEFPWMSQDQISGAVAWEAGFRALIADTTDVDAAHTYLVNTITPTTAGTAGMVSYDLLGFTQGADSDNVANGQRFILRVQRDPTNGSDNMTNNAEILSNAIAILEA